MAKNMDSKKGMAAGLFTAAKDPAQPQEVKTVSEQEAPAQEMSAEPSPEVKQEERHGKAVFRKVGRPRDGDLQDGEETKPTTIQLTDDIIYKLDAYLLDNKPKSRSQVIRELIRNYL